MEDTTVSTTEVSHETIGSHIVDETESELLSDYSQRQQIIDEITAIDGITDDDIVAVSDIDVVDKEAEVIVEEGLKGEILSSLKEISTSFFYVIVEANEDSDEDTEPSSDAEGDDQPQTVSISRGRELSEEEIKDKLVSETTRQINEAHILDVNKTGGQSCEVVVDSSYTSHCLKTDLAAIDTDRHYDILVGGN